MSFRHEAADDNTASSRELAIDDDGHGGVTVTIRLKYGPSKSEARFPLPEYRLKALIHWLEQRRPR